MDKSAKQLLLGSGVIAAGASAVGAASYALTKKMVSIALDRELPKVKDPEKAKKQLQGREVDPVFLHHLESAGQQLRQSPHQLVSLTGYDGKTLVGHWFPRENAKRVIVAMHGWRSSWWRDFGSISAFWKEQACSVLYAEQRGQGLSEGDHMGFGMTERYDCRDWARWASKRCPRLPVYLAGVSMGAATVLMATQLQLPDTVCGIMADCGFTSPDAIWRYIARNNLGIPYGLRSYVADSICRKKIQMSARSCSTVQAMRDCRIPVLFAHGEEDHFVPVEMTLENYSACAAPKTLLVVPGADHGMSYYMDKDRYEAATKDFWQMYDSAFSKWEMRSTGEDVVQ